MRRSDLMPTRVLCKVFHAVTQTLSARYVKACIEVQGLVKQSLEKITSKDQDFIAEGIHCPPPVGKSCSTGY